MRKTVVAGTALALTAVLVSAAPATAGPRPGTPGQFGQIMKRAQQLHDLEMSDDDELRLGAAVSQRIRERYGVVQDPAIHKYVALVGNVLAAKSDRPQLPWKFIVLDTDGVNALAAPGGYVHITRGALSLMKNEAELAGVLGHEIIHVTEKHTVRAIQKGKAIQMGADETLSNSPALFNKLVDKATDAVMAGFGRGEELEADEKGIIVASKAGYDPTGLRSFLATLKERNKNSSGKQGLFASHPEMDERLEKLDKEVKSKKLGGSVTMEARFRQHMTYTPVSLAAVTTIEAGAAGLAGDSGSGKDDSKDKPADGEKKKKRGFGLSALTAPSDGGEKKSAEVTGSGAARGVDTERNAKGGPNPKPLDVKVSAAELNGFKKDGNLN
jgi:predicted Zn-dependent protease